MESLTDRVLPSAAALSLPEPHAGPPAHHAPVDPCSQGPLSQPPGKDSSAACTEGRPLCGATITTNGVEIKVFGPDATQVQLLLLAAAGLFASPLPTPTVRPDNAEAAFEPQNSSRLRTRRLRERLPALAGDLEILEQLVDRDVPSALNKVRFITEKILYHLCVRGDVTWGRAKPTLERMVGPLVSAGVVPKNIAIYIRIIQANASPGSHYQETPLSDANVRIARDALLEFLEWAATAPGAEEGRESH
jgi:hypothetical protein